MLRMYHEEQADYNWDQNDRRIADVDYRRAQSLVEAKYNLAENDVADDAECYSEGQVILKDVESLSIFDRFFHIYYLQFTASQVCWASSLQRPLFGRGRFCSS